MTVELLENDFIKLNNCYYKLNTERQLYKYSYNFSEVKLFNSLTKIYSGVFPSGDGYIVTDNKNVTCECGRMHNKYEKFEKSTQYLIYPINIMNTHKELNLIKHSDLITMTKIDSTEQTEHEKQLMNTFKITKMYNSISYLKINLDELISNIEVNRDVFEIKNETIKSKINVIHEYYSPMYSIILKYCNLKNSTVITKFE